MTKNNVETIGKILGTVEQVDVSPNGECRGPYIRVRVNIDINQPQPLWISFQYERMPIFVTGAAY